MSYTLISLAKSPPWSEVCGWIKTSDKDVVVGLKSEADLASDAAVLSVIAYRECSTGILAGTTLKPFPELPTPEFPQGQIRIFSRGRQIISLLGITPERVNIQYGDTLASNAATDTSTLEAHSFWGSVFFIKREVLNQIAGPDANYSPTGMSCAPNIIWDDLALQVRQVHYQIRTTSCVTAQIAGTPQFLSDTNHSYQYWEQKWGWNPLIPNVDCIRSRWTGTPIAYPVMEHLLDSWPSEEPAVDVIMLTGNNLANLQRCLESLGKTRYPSLTLHVLLNGSGQVIIDYLEEAKTSLPFPINVIAHPINLGIPVGLNYLHTRCSAPLVLRLDDDMTLPADGLSRMVATLRRYPFAGAVLPSIQGPSIDPGKPNHYVPPLRLHPASPGPNNMPPFPYQQTYRTNFMGGACVLFRKKAIDLAGDYDIRYTPSQSEDMDYGTYLRALGYDIIVLGSVIALGYPSSFSKSSYDLTLGMGFQAHYLRHKWGAVGQILELGLDRDGRILD